jgi:chemotaxis protein MotA
MLLPHGKGKSRMFIIIGLVVVFGSVIAGYTMHHGNLAVLMQVSEFIIIGGAGLGSMLIGNPPSVVMGVFKQCIALLKGNPYKKSSFSELLQVLFELFQTAKRDGMLALEAHVERPHESEIFRKYPFFLHNHHAVSFLTDTLKVLLTGSVDRHDLAEILELDLESHHEEAMVIPGVLAKIGDAMPGFGIVAAVLGVVITMGSIGGAAQEIGQKVAAALVGTFVGILLAYGVFQPLAQACENVVRGEGAYMACIKTAILSFSRGDPPITTSEFARRNIEPSLRPSFSEMEQAISALKGSAA